MKSIKYILTISLALIVTTLPASACYIYFPDNDEYVNIFRAYSPTMESQGLEGRRLQESDKYLNCLLWQKITSPSIPLADIERVVYDAPLLHLSNLAQGPLAGNKFAQWLAEPAHSDDLRYLVTAKEIEEIRDLMNSAWYYPYDGDDEHARLDSLTSRCMAYQGSRHQARYALQLTRLYFANKDFEACRALWENKVSSMPQDIVTDMIASYAGGAYLRGGNRPKAIELYDRGQDIGSLRYIKAWDGALASSSYADPRVKEMEYIFSRYPDSPMLSVLLQKYVGKREQFVHDFDDWKRRGFNDPANVPTKWVGDSLVAVTDDDFYNELTRFANSVVASPKCHQKGLWLYSLAYLSYLDNDRAKASALLSRAEKSQASPFIKESVKAFRMLFDAHDARGTKAYKDRLLGQLKWLDEMMARDAKSKQPDEYWLQVARRALSGEACPRLEKMGLHSLALQLDNYVSTYNIRLSPSTYSALNYGSPDDDDEELTDDEHKRQWAQNRLFGYSTTFFEKINAATADEAARYALTISSPASPLDKFLNDRSIVDTDYIFDIVGTLYLREMNYKEAARWLSKVSSDHQGRTNVAKEGYFRLDPFLVQADEKQFIADSCDYKLRFALEMSNLEDIISFDAEPNRMASAKLRYATGLRNSFGRCWYLTDYGFSGYYEDYKQISLSASRKNFKDNPFAQRAYRRVDELTAQALAEFTDLEMAAKAQLSLKNFKTVTDKYPSTKAAAYVRGHCDTYHDYTLQGR
ncbi:MAG: hypothetical protein NC342_01180 [Pseudoflavonifractor sp.]|nr:hypothetical protein [Alloprevotella sp.]MCM1116136.1 hypothetical protein [Pseudoflavonifractor sp.]